MSANLGKSICIVGTGSSGLAAIKCFVEEGYNVKAFERTENIGGLWHYSLDPNQTTAMPGTTTNVSRQLVCANFEIVYQYALTPTSTNFSDFPFPKSTKDFHPSSKEIELYLESYADHFDLRRHIELSTEVLSLRRDEAKDQWIVTTRPKTGAAETFKTYSFDRVIIATGPHSKPSWPVLKAREQFKGEVLHAFSFKEPAKYEGKTVVVVGFNATAADSIEYLRKAGAKKIYVSHRRSVVVIPRMIQGKALDHNLTRRIAIILDRMRQLSPSFFSWALSKLVKSMQKGAWPNLHKQVAFAPPRVMPQALAIPCVSDNLPINLMEGHVDSVQAIDHFNGPQSIKLVDGRVLEDIDACILATGSQFNIASLLPPEADPTDGDLAPHLYDQLKGTKYYSEGESYRPAYLYRNFLSVQYPHSLAFLGYGIYKGAWFPMVERFSMALAQLWQGNYPMPSRTEMDREVTKHFNFLIGEYDQGYISHAGLSHDLGHNRWLHDVAGTELYDRTGWGWKGWKLWFFDRPLYKLLVDGLELSFADRLFVTKRGRKSWPGARQAIEDTNREVDERAAEWKREQEQEKQKRKST